MRVHLDLNRPNLLSPEETRAIVGMLRGAQERALRAEAEAAGLREAVAQALTLLRLPP